MSNPTRSQLKKEFFSGAISLKQFKKSLKEAFRYRGIHMKPGKKPKWSGPFRNSMKAADADNAPYYNAGYTVDVYVEQ